jgi:steroid delta-isomerase-like uncharacterized protein
MRLASFQCTIFLLQEARRGKRAGKEELYMSTENKALVRRAFEAGWNTGNLDLFDETTAPEYVLHDPSVPEDVRGVEGVKRFASMYLQAFPDLRFTIEDQLAEGDKVVTRWTSSATHQGELMGIPATGNQTGVSGITISRVSEGKLVEDWNNWDTLGLMRQLGVIPEPGESAQQSH